MPARRALGAEVGLAGGLVAEVEPLRVELAGKCGDVAGGEVSITTYGTSTLTTLAPGGTIEITGLNDVVINSVVGEGNPELALIDIKSLEGTLTLMKESGQIKSGALIKLSGKNLVIDGVVESALATPDLTDPRSEALGQHLSAA